MLLGLVISAAGDRPMGLMLWWKPFNADDVATLLDMVGSGAIAPVIDRRFPLAELVEALHWVDDGHARGKVVITG